MVIRRYSGSPPDPRGGDLAQYIGASPARQEGKRADPRFVRDRSWAPSSSAGAAPATRRPRSRITVRGRRTGRQAPWHFLYFSARTAAADVVAADPPAVRGVARPGRAGTRRSAADDLVAERSRGPRGRPARRAGPGRPAGTRRRRPVRRAPAAPAAGPRRPRPAAARPPPSSRSAASVAASGIGIGVGGGGGWRVTVTRKIVLATWWRMKSRSSVYSANASRRNSLSGSCWA